MHRICIFLKIGVLWLATLFVMSHHSLNAEQIPILKVATINVPPMAYMDPETMIVTGEVTKLVQERSQACGAQVAFIFTPSWARAYQMALTGTADGLIPTTYTENRLSDFDYAQPPLYDLRPSLIVLQSSSYHRFIGLKMLAQSRIGIRAKAMLIKSFDDYLASGNVTVVERANSKGLAEALFAGQVDFIVDSPSVIRYQLGSDQVEEKVRILEPSLGQSLQYLALSKKRAAPFRQGTALSKCLLATE